MKMRRMRPNHSTRTPGNLAFFDTETMPCQTGNGYQEKVHHLRLWCMSGCRYEGNRMTRTWYEEGHTQEEFWDEIASRLDPKRPLWLWAHNTGFDLTSLRFWERLEEREYTFDEPEDRFLKRLKRSKKAKRRGGLCVIESPPLILKLWHASGCQLIVCDTFNWFQQSLESLGKQFGIPKFTMPPFEADDTEWFRYCRRDTEIVEKVVCSLMGFVRKHDLGVFKYTASSQSLACYQHRFMHHEILCHDEPSLKSQERNAYYAGKVEAFYNGEIAREQQPGNGKIWPVNEHGSILPSGPLFLVDVNSLYPHVMATNEYPYKLKRVHADPSLSLLEDVAINGAGLAEVSIRCTNTDYPMRHHGEVIYVQGNFRTWLCGPELLRAVQRSDVWDCSVLFEYELAPLFADFVEYFWALRQEEKVFGKDCWADLAKLLMNSLYGKWAQQTPDWSDCPLIASPEPWGTFVVPETSDKNARVYRSIGWHAQESTGRRELSWTMPAISAWITSHGREFMRCFTDRLPKEGVFYQGVDSLIIDESSYITMRTAGDVADETIGRFKLKSQGEDGFIGGPHWYRIGEVKVEGWHSKRAVPTGKEEWTETVFTSLPEMLSTKPPLGPIEQTRVKRREQGHRRNIILKTGFTRPLVCPEELSL